MKNKGCVNQGCTGCLWLFVYLLIFAIAISGLGFYGLSIGIIGAVLAYTSPIYRKWLSSQRGFQSRLSKLPGMASSSPTTLALSTLAYTIPLSLISWSFLLGSFGKTDTTITAAIMGLIGLVLLFGWFIKGWGITSTVTTQQGQHTNNVQETQYFNRIRKLDEIRQLDPIAFERFVGSLFEKMGYQVQTTPLSGDEGIDLVLRKGSKLAIVQCKRYENSVGQPVVRDLYGAMVHNKADEAYLVTTGTVTLPAQQWVVGKPLHLVDGNTLIEWVETFKKQEISQPTNVITNETDNSKVSQEGVIGYFRQNPIASIAIPIALLLPLCCCLVGTWVSPIVITATPTKTPITPTPTKLPPTVALIPSETPIPKPTSILSETVTFTPESISTTMPTPTEKVSAILPGLKPADITENLEQRGFTCSSVEQGQLYYVRTCNKNTADYSLHVEIYGRELFSVDFIDSTVLQFSTPDNKFAGDFLGFMATMPYDGATQDEARTWVETTLPTLKGQGDVREKVFSGVNYRLFGLPTAITLEMGNLP